MKVAIIGSRGITVDRLGDYLPPDVTEIISGGARGVDACAADLVLAFWDGTSPGTKFVIDQCRRMGKPIKIWVKK